MSFMSPLSAFLGKGGVGKSTSVASVAMAQANAGKKILVIDMDGGRALARVLEVEKTPSNTISSTSVPHLFTAPIQTTYRFKRARESSTAQEYFSQFPGIYGAVCFNALLSEFFGASVDINGLCRLIALGEVLEQARRDGFDEIIIDVEPTSGFERLLNSLDRMHRSLNNIAKIPAPLFKLFGDERSKYLTGFVKSEFAINRETYLSRLMKTRDAIRKGRFSIVSIAEPEPITQGMNEVLWLVNKIGGNVDSIIVNNYGRADADEQMEEDCLETARVTAQANGATLRIIPHDPSMFTGDRHTALRNIWDLLTSLGPIEPERRSSKQGAQYAWEDKSLPPTIFSDIEGDGMVEDRHQVKIAVGKWGVGKSTTAASQWVYYAHRNEKTLLIDLDGWVALPRVLQIATPAPNTIKASGIDHLHIASVRPDGNFRPRSDFRSHDAYMEQFPRAYGLLGFNVMLSEFFGICCDIEWIHKLITLGEILDTAINKESFERIIIDVEPTSGFEQLFNSLDNTVEVLDELRRTSWWLLSMLWVKWPDIAEFLKGSYVKSFDVYADRLRKVRAAIRSAHFSVVSTAEPEPVKQATEDVHTFVESIGWEVGTFILNNCGRTDTDDEVESGCIGVMERSANRVGAILRKIPHAHEMFSSNRLSILRKIGESLSVVLRKKSSVVSRRRFEEGDESMFSEDALPKNFDWKEHFDPYVLWLQWYQDEDEMYRRIDMIEINRLVNEEYARIHGKKTDR